MATDATHDGYSGVEEGNSIFEGRAFWVALRVPMRKELVNNIKLNGGVVVPLEKDAYMCIADHARKDAPAGSYSWKFINDSLEHGIMQIKDKYRIGPDPDLPRPVGVGGKTKSGRTPFTSAEDAALARWVLSHKVDRTGNKIYQEFEQMNPSHTWQSWRNRFVKQLSLMPISVLERLVADSPEEPGEQPSVDGGKKQIPKVSPQTIQPQRRDKGMEAEVEVAPSKREDKPTIHSKPKARRESQVKAPAIVRHNAAPPPKKCSTAPVESEMMTDVSDEVEDNQVEDNEEETEEEQEATEDRGSRAISEESTHPISQKEQFYIDLLEFAEVWQMDIEPNFRIGNKELELWDLVQAICVQELAPEELDWMKVADEIGFNSAHIEEAAQGLRLHYNKYLAVFMDAMASLPMDDSNATDLESEPAAGIQEPQPRQMSPQSYMPSSPPAGLGGVKRPLDSDQLSSAGNLRKRMRLSRGTIIPSTPDEKTGNVGYVEPDQIESPSLRRSLRHAGRVLDYSVQNLGTKDVYFDTPPKAVMATESPGSAFDVTPSQQLLSEANHDTPIPLRFQKTQSVDKAQTAREIPTRPARQAESSQDPQRELPRTQVAANANTALSTQRKAVKRSLPPDFRAPQKSAPVQGEQRKTSAVRHQPPLPQPRPPQQQQRQRQQPPQQPRSTAVDSRKKNKRDQTQWQIEDWIEYYESLGYSRDIIIEALKSTTLTPSTLALTAMKSLKQQQGIPTHHSGIWSERDDKGLLMIDSVNSKHGVRNKKVKAEWDRLEEKHGLERMELRRKFLATEAKVSQSLSQV